MYLVDTNVISAGAPTKAQPMPDLARWMDRNSERLYLSVITVAELESGIAKARLQAATGKADRLAAWLQTVLHLYSPRILPLDITVARLLGQLSDQARAGGQSPGLADLFPQPRRGRARSVRQPAGRRMSHGAATKRLASPPRRRT